MIFDLHFLLKRLEEATEPSRVLDGDFWWIATLNDAERDQFAPTWSYFLTVVEREQSPGRALILIQKDSLSGKYTSSIDALLNFIGYTRPEIWPFVVVKAVSNMGQNVGSHRELSLEMARVYVRLLIQEQSV